MAGRRIQWRLFAAFLALAIGVTLPAAILLERWLGAEVRGLVRGSLAREAKVLAAELERAPPSDLPAWVRRVESPAGARVTVIDPDGTVRADSDVPVEELPRMENHRTRPEIAVALLGGAPGSDVRRSATPGAT
jgi:two-component system phosphate regulon sensor histidine kinase PhoR